MISPAMVRCSEPFSACSEAGVEPMVSGCMTGPIEGPGAGPTEGFGAFAMTGNTGELVRSGSRVGSGPPTVAGPNADTFPQPTTVQCRMLTDQ